MSVLLTSAIYIDSVLTPVGTTVSLGYQREQAIVAAGEGTWVSIPTIPIPPATTPGFASITTSPSGGVSVAGPNGTIITPIGITQLSMSSAQAIANDTATPLQFDSAVVDTFGTWVIGSPSNIVVPAQATRMRVMYHCEWSIDATKTGYRSLRMLVNGSTTVNPYVSSTTVGTPNGVISDHNNCVSLIMGCTAGDILTFSARHTMGSSINLIAASQRVVVEWFAG